jgi:pimeloyl-ACP methyl ester carboxylesterase
VLRVAGDGVNLAVLEQGDGPAVLLLHGFPDSSHVWRYQVPALAGAGLRVLAPDLRGFGESDRPERVDDYRMRHLVADVVALVDGLGVEKVRVVGHDWGAALAWVFAATVPDRVERLVAMSVGNPNTHRTRSIEQRQKSWYMLLFQFHDVAERLITRDDWKLFREFLGGAGDQEQYLRDLSRPGALTAALNWYRANLAPEIELKTASTLPPVAAPTLGLWSSGDAYLTEDQMLASTDHVSGTWRYVRVEGASHWMQLDAREQINDLLVEFLT